MISQFSFCFTQNQISLILDSRFSDFCFTVSQFSYFGFSDFSFRIFHLRFSVSQFLLSQIPNSDFRIPFSVPTFNFKFLRHDISGFSVSHSHFGHSIAFFALIFWLLQIFTGFLLLGLLAWALEIQFTELISISLHGNFVWLLRLFHMLGANFCVITIVVHFGKALSFSRVISSHKFIVWLSGSFIFLLSLGTAFSGYVVVSGNMSFWAALVILNLFSVVPIFGEEIVAGILSGSTVSSWAIRRFTVIHFLLAIISFLVVAIHIVILHRQNPGYSSAAISSGKESLANVLVKDFSLGLTVAGILFFASVKSLIHPDNWGSFSRLSTPAHIEPEIYFLWSFSVIKLHNSKLLGAAFNLHQARYFDSPQFLLQSLLSSLPTNLPPSFCKPELRCPQIKQQQELNFRKLLFRYVLLLLVSLGLSYFSSLVFYFSSKIIISVVTQASYFLVSEVNFFIILLCSWLFPKGLF